MKGRIDKCSAQSLRFKRLCIFGAGGSGREAAWLAREAWGDALEVFFAVDDPCYLTGEINDIPVSLVQRIVNTSDTAFVAAVGHPALRRKAVSACERAGMSAATIIHPRTEMSEHVELGAGTIVCAGSVLTTNVTVGAHSQINVGCTVSHDVLIGDFSTLSPGCHVAGHVHIGHDVFIGIGVNIINGRSGEPLVIGNGATIAAGACVTQPVEPGSMVAGVPARRKR